MRRMQIVINIPEEDYKGICHLKNEQLRMLPEEVAETLIRIANGTSLDKIRAEIEQRPYGVVNDSVIQGMKYERVAILEIIDKYREGKV